MRLYGAPHHTAQGIGTDGKAVHAHLQPHARTQRALRRTAFSSSVSAFHSFPMWLPSCPIFHSGCSFISSGRLACVKNK